MVSLQHAKNFSIAGDRFLAQENGRSVWWRVFYLVEPRMVADILDSEALGRIRVENEI